MAWYDLFSRFYDESLEPHYRDQRAAAVAALVLRPGETVLDVPCGTGQSAPGLCAAVGPTGCVLGFDASPGMARIAAARKERAGLASWRIQVGDVRTLEESRVHAAAGAPRPIDALHIFLGLSVFPDHERCFERLFALLRPGGRCVVVDVWNPNPGLQGHMVNLLAQADIRRRFWEPLERVALDFERRELPSKTLHGGAIWLASGRKAP